MDVDPVIDNALTSQSFVVLENVPSASTGGGSRDRCFIATAAYGSYLEPEVETLRRFRDTYLMTNAPGRALVDWYYAHSPPLADFIADRPTLRLMTRVSLTPIAYGLEYPVFAALLSVAALLVLGFEYRRRRALAAAR